VYFMVWGFWRLQTKKAKAASTADAQLKLLQYIQQNQFQLQRDPHQHGRSYSTSSQNPKMRGSVPALSYQPMEEEDLAQYLNTANNNKRRTAVHKKGYAVPHSASASMTMMKYPPGEQLNNVFPSHHQKQQQPHHHHQYRAPPASLNLRYNNNIASPPP